MTTADINIDSNNKNEQYTQNLYYNGSGSSDLIYGANNNGTSLSISKSREKRMTKLLVVGIILPFSVLFNIQASEIPAWYNKKTKEPLSFPFYIVALRIIGQIAGASATIALFLKSVHIGSSFRILKWRLHKKHRGVIMIVGALIQCLCSIKRIFRQSGVKPKNRLSYMQRQLIVLEILGIFYIIIGGILFSKLENWSFNDSIYFTVTTLMTCGSGDYSPASFFGQFALMAYSIPGIALTTYTVYSVYSVISEILYAKVYKDFSRFINSSNDMYFQNLVKNDKSSSNSIINFGDDIPSTSNEQGNNINEEKKWTSPDDKGKIKVLSLPQNNKDSSNVSFNINILEQNKKEPLFFKSKQSILFNESNNAIPVQTLRFDALSNDSYDSSDSSSSSDEDEENPELRHLLSSRSNSYFKQESTISDQLVIPNYNSIQPNLSFIKDDSFRHRSISYQGNDYYSDIDEKSGKKAFMLTRRNTFNINQSSVQGMKLFSTNQNINTEQVLKKTRDLNVRQLKISVTLLVLLILFFSLIYSWIEDWSFFESIYFCFINLCTIGYGDFVPKSVYGKSIYIYFMYSAVSATTWMGTVLLELATGRWEIYIEKTDLEDELFKNDFNKKREEQQEKKKEIEEEEIEEEKQQ